MLLVTVFKQHGMGRQVATMTMNTIRGLTVHPPLEGPAAYVLGVQCRTLLGPMRQLTKELSHIAQLFFLFSFFLSIVNLYTLCIHCAGSVCIHDVDKLTRRNCPRSRLHLPLTSTVCGCCCQRCPFSSSLWLCTRSFNHSIITLFVTANRIFDDYS